MRTTAASAGSAPLPSARRSLKRGAGRRVLIIVQNLPVPFDRRVWQEANELVTQGYQVAVICPTGRGHEARYECLNGIHIYRHPLPFEAKGALGYLIEYSCSLFWELLLSLRVLKRHGFDLIHACNPPDNIFLIAALYKFFGGKRFLFDHHDINPELYEAKFARRDVFYRLLRLWERLTFALADVSIATNESYRHIALTRGHMAPERVFVVRSGPSLERLQLMAPDPTYRRGRAHLVGYVGVIGQQEGIQYLIEAVAHIVHHCQRTDVQFALVGGGPALKDMQRLARERGVSEYVHFTGRVPDQELLAVLNSADVCVNPDEANPMNDKSTMNKIMEYMALGKPIVQFDLTEGRFSAQQASLYARPNDAIDLARQILTLIDDPLLRAQMGEFGRARVEHELAWPFEAPRLLAAYDYAFDQIPVRGLARLLSRSGRGTSGSERTPLGLDLGDADEASSAVGVGGQHLDGDL
jgi:glycosyltransferase involved in cell wall biosynthesis